VSDSIEIERCVCGTLEHHLIWCFDDKHDPEYLYLSVHVNPYYSWYKRIWIGLKYIFGSKFVDGHYDELMLDRAKVVKMRDKLNDVLSKMPEQ